jgi:hypothetical protein
VGGVITGGGADYSTFGQAANGEDGLMRPGAGMPRTRPLHVMFLSGSSHDVLWLLNPPATLPCRYLSKKSVYTQDQSCECNGDVTPTMFSVESFGTEQLL